MAVMSLFAENIAILEFHPYDDYLYPLIAVFIGFYIFGYIARQLVEHFHPLYIFDNLGEKIQKLTPNIEEQSKNIQSEFESTMDFSVLSHGFELLSRNFSEIVQLIIKLEKAEKQANK
jgi:predicted PurR-regulated permease PerM